VADAIASGDCDPRSVARTNMVSVSISVDEAPAEMAVAAARMALERAESSGVDVDLLLHANCYYQGHDMWAVASYIQRETVRNHCMAIEVRQMSNGGMAALDLASSYLMAGQDRSDALITTADRFCRPGFDRWATDVGTPYADGGTAAVLSARGGYARIRSVAVLADSELEPLHRGNVPFGRAPLEHGMPIDFDAAKQVFTEQYGLSFGINKVVACQQAVIKQALADAELDLHEIGWFVLPHFGWRRLETTFLNNFGIDPTRTTWEWSRTVGHLGAGDQFASLGHLVDSGRAKPGDRCLLVGIGAGFTWGCAVVEIVDVPGWVS
jgi:3-oxoacyl-[acyl-carrier-protein] synthase-3